MISIFQKEIVKRFHQNADICDDICNIIFNIFINSCVTLAVDRNTGEGNAERAEVTGSIHRRGGKLHVEIEKHGEQVSVVHSDSSDLHR